MNHGLKYHVITFGCQMNKSDSERIATLIEGLGYSSVDRFEDADFVLLNTCSVRQTAEDRVFGFMKEFGKIKEHNARFVVGVTGCMAGRDRNGVLRSRLPVADLFFPTRDLPELPRLLSAFHPEIVNAGDIVTDYLKLQPKWSAEHTSYVTIQTGCNKFCTYCVVPFARGLENNRPVADILREVRARAERGSVEIVLLGQTVNSYRAPDPDTFQSANPFSDHFAALLWEVNQIEGVRRIHFTAPHPLHMTDEVIEAMTLPKHVRYLHLPVQSGDNEVLRKMNRRYTREQFLECIGRIRARIPDIAIGTDIIVGFCGETEEMFERTVDLYRAVDFDISYTAQYSPRSGTAAHKAFKDDVSREEKKRRWNVLQDLMEETVLRRNQVYVGKTLEVLVNSVEEGTGDPVCTGFSCEMKTVRFLAQNIVPGMIVPVRIVLAREWVLDGTRAGTVPRDQGQSPRVGTVTL